MDFDKEGVRNIFHFERCPCLPTFTELQGKTRICQTGFGFPASRNK